MPRKPKKAPPRSEWIDLPAPERIAAVGHRAFVGGDTPRAWFAIARRQYHFLVAQGLRPGHRFLDVACGSLRLGQFLIPFLDEGHYFGLEAEPALVQAGLRHELLFGLADLKKPVFGHGYDFDFSFVPGFDIAMAQSLFTHLTEDDIALCLGNLRDRANDNSRLFFTFFDDDRPNTEGPSHANKSWYYTFAQIDAIANRCGWCTRLIGDWGHERGQSMVEAHPA